MSHIFATNIGWSLYSERSEFRLVLLNTFGDSQNKQREHDEFEFYYPVSPHKAVLLTKRICFTHGQVIEIDGKDVDLYNQKIIEVAHEQVYSSSKAHFEEIFS
ncbi:MAG: hypothetical protein ACI9SP_004033 [Arenicella sp.]|jgi:hypothetical protein